MKHIFQGLLVHFLLLQYEANVTDNIVAEVNHQCHHPIMDDVQAVLL